MLRLFVGYVTEDAWIDGEFNAGTSTFETMGGAPIPMSEGNFWAWGKPDVPGPGVCVRMHEVYNHLLDDRACTHVINSVSICEQL